MSWKGLENIFAKRLEDVLKTSWRCLEDVFARRLEDVLKTSSEDEDERLLQDVCKTSSSGRMFAGKLLKGDCRCTQEDVWY